MLHEMVCYSFIVSLFTFDHVSPMKIAQLQAAIGASGEDICLFPLAKWLYRKKLVHSRCDMPISIALAVLSSPKQSASNGKSIEGKETKE
jgi:hypothetical protein